MRTGVIWVALYLATIVASNWAVSEFGAVPVGFGLEAPAAVYFAGLAFTFRDIVHDAYGAKGALIAIAIGTLISIAVDPVFAIASGVAFSVSEIADLAVYSRLREKTWLGAVSLSNTVGLTIDSMIFLWLAFGSLAYLHGQIVGKMWMTILAIVIISLWRNYDRLSVRLSARESA